MPITHRKTVNNIAIKKKKTIRKNTKGRWSIYNTENFITEAKDIFLELIDDYFVGVEITCEVQPNVCVLKIDINNEPKCNDSDVHDKTQKYYRNLRYRKAFAACIHRLSSCFQCTIYSVKDNVIYANSFPRTSVGQNKYSFYVIQ